MIKIRILVIPLFVFLIIGCFHLDDNPKKMYYKIVKTGKCDVRWYFKSLLTSKPPDIIDIVEGTKSQIICQAGNIIDVQVIGTDTILIDFNGPPKRYGKSISIPDRIYGIQILVDSTDRFRLNPTFPTFEIE